jgi:hypothetical protein
MVSRLQLAKNKGVVRTLAVPLLPEFKMARVQFKGGFSLPGPAKEGRRGSIDIRQV